MHFHVWRFTSPFINHLKNKFGSTEYESRVWNQLFCVESEVDGSREGEGGRSVERGSGDNGRKCR
jgi:hypothetical protein